MRTGCPAGRPYRGRHRREGHADQRQTDDSGTVKAHVSRARAKLGPADRVQMALLVRDAGLKWLPRTNAPVWMQECGP
ncbi:hypothetical protein HOK021_42370 [Streptomyces hygroscopicus]|nr:hypothetical protein HOK021_42370 [Streptomyces hygroscopicus]